MLASNHPVIMRLEEKKGCFLLFINDELKTIFQLPEPTFLISFDLFYRSHSFCGFFFQSLKLNFKGFKNNNQIGPFLFGRVCYLSLDRSYAG